MKTVISLVTTCSSLSLCVRRLQAQTITEKVKGMEKFPGFFTFYWDAKAGKIWLEIDKWNTEFLYVGVVARRHRLERHRPRSRTTRQQFDRSFRSQWTTRVCSSRRTTLFARTTNNADERLAVKDAFAESTLWGFEVAAEESGRVLVDATSFYLRDVHQVTNTLQRGQQGTYRLEPTRSAFYLPNTKNFPQNTEVETTLTFTGEPTGQFVRQVVPVPEAITVRERHSFVQLPPPGYKPRVFDPRAGYFGIDYMDFATPIEEPITKRFIARHRLQKKDPAARVSEAVEPIVYYVDRGAPEPVRSALLEGARWWNQAFEAIGYKDAFRVEVMPPNSRSDGCALQRDPVGASIDAWLVLWQLACRSAHRRDHSGTRFARIVARSAGLLDRGRFAGAVQQHEHGIAETAGDGARAFASTLGARSGPHVGTATQLRCESGQSRIGDGLSRAVGEARMRMVCPIFRTRMRKASASGTKSRSLTVIRIFRPGTNEPQALDTTLKEAFRARSDVFDRSGRTCAGQFEFGGPSLGQRPNAIDELGNVMKVRAAALRRFGENNIREGAPLATIEEVLVPIYMYHRYQVEAAAKVIGGQDYTFSLKGKGDRNPQIVAPEEQRRALAAVLDTIKPEALSLPEPLLRLIPPRPAGYPRNRETVSHAHAACVRRARAG